MPIRQLLPKLSKQIDVAFDSKTVAEALRKRHEKYLANVQLGQVELLIYFELYAFKEGLCLLRRVFYFTRSNGLLRG